MSLYFLVATLPVLKPGDKPPFTPEAFLQRCGEALPPADEAVLRDLMATGGAGSRHPFAVAWQARETEIRNATVRLRARRRRVQPEPWLRPEADLHLYIQKAVTEAFQQPDPLERERALDQLRWGILEDLAGLNPFGIEAVFSYGLRLRLVWRWASFNREAGEALLDQAASGAAAPLSPTQKALA